MDLKRQERERKNVPVHLRKLVKFQSSVETIIVFTYQYFSNSRDFPMQN